ncbi:CDP-alcohol phosphatidyltransferase family protein [Reyranella sp.]|uniref:CDP-alcohol phosphatidyltransferase family protein n=1 Tax=Reyranella sp. TaxID=1929291 RepID=UPI003BABD2E7
MTPDDRPEAARENGGWLAGPERRALLWLAPRVPSWLTPNGLTAIGFAAAVLAFVGYVLAVDHPAALWLVNLALVANWFGDSLDGHVARLRGIERPRFGFFLDQSVDVLSQLVFALGLAVSGYIRPEIVMLGLATYLMMTAQSLLRAQVSGVFHLATQGMGLTEVRCLFLVGNGLFFSVPPQPFSVGGITLAYPDLFGMLWILTNAGLFIWTMIAELRQLARQEPPTRNRPPSDD